jgi:hypothetical protein
MEDWYHQKVKITESASIGELWTKFEDQRLDHFSKKMGQTYTQKGEYLDFLVRQKVCPHGVITKQSIYWLELISYMDSEMGLNLPYGYHETPNIFFQALGIVREERSKIRREEERGRQKNSNSNQGGGNGVSKPSSPRSNS